MIDVLVTLTVVFHILLVTQVLWYKGFLDGEYSRKLVHIVVGIYGAFWPLYLSWREIQIIILISVFFFLITRVIGIFKSVYDVERRSLGDFTAPLTVGALTFLNLEPVIFAAAVLHIALADGFAAVVGARYGRGNEYKVFGSVKSVAGSVTFLVVSAVITAWAVFFSGTDFGQAAWPLLICLPLLTTLIENIGAYGTDNLLIAITVIAVLK